ncbi:MULTISPECIES: CBS domain-containing protein [Sphaerochaeta]|jgi:CBS domain-containing protein|uniref:CBS domain-containing protein n=2 Tax=root TaxID=1 RepID=A0ABY4DEG3_9SPIR|nr:MULTISPECIES: CBS domain-containing protein [Sphaerochaeta]MDT3359830.1 CBS domain-containing protein [Spirochaetota bacterium]NLA98687.1 CBS domain-containing protein [Spirochaetales bacterium]MDD3425103.1 CBS domain-containing protein [Sphaerochaeta sp.]MDD3457645.1 CBS domain-containing protein [Sphaerochaeta sp.]MDD4038268.1 CBS domain-containing protein [Sphaerochaeta sp.]
MQEIPINTITSPNVILELIYRLKVKDVMTTDLVTATKETTLRQIQYIMREKQVTGLPIVVGKRLIGIVSMDDIIQALDKGYIEEKAQDHMTRNLIVLEDDMPISFAISYFDRFSYHRFPVLNKHKELVGMITSRDITSTLLVEINREIEELEKRTRTTSLSEEMSGEIHTYSIMKNDFENAGYASTEIKKRLKSAGIAPHIIRRAAIASYELEMNLVVHSDGGELIAEYSPQTMQITAKDSGPGISDVEAAMTPGWSTASEWIRSLGFGAGMGLPNVKSVADEFTIESNRSGTTVVCSIALHPKQEET